MDENSALGQTVPTLWLIPARGGSKGIPGKNVKEFCGRPLVCRAVDQAMECATQGDVVFVTTDDDIIAGTAMTCGDVVPFMRPAELATDTSSSYDVILHAINEFEARGKYFRRVVLLQPTSPLRGIDDIRGAVRLWTPDVDMVVSVCESGANPYYNLFETGPDGTLHVSKGDGRYTRRQDAPKVWEYNGAVYVISVTALKNGPMSEFRKKVPFPMSSDRSVDLDTPLDWKIAEMLYNESHCHGSKNKD